MTQQQSPQEACSHGVPYRYACELCDAPQPFHPTTKELIDDLGVRGTADMYKLLGFSFKNCYKKIFGKYPPE